MSVQSIFSHGKFEQVLDLIRVPDDLVNTKVESTNTSKTSSSSTSTQSTNDTQLGPTTGTPFTNPRPENVTHVEPDDGPLENPKELTKNEL